MIKLTYDGEFTNLRSALGNNQVHGSAQIKEVLAELSGVNDELNWHWLVKLENDKIAYITGFCDYTGWDCQSGVAAVLEFDSLEHALSAFGLPRDCVNSDRKIREEFREILNKMPAIINVTLKGQE